LVIIEWSVVNNNDAPEGSWGDTGTAATLALEDGMSPHIVAAMLGHASVATTLSLYAHATDASQVALVDAIDARYGPRLRVVAGSELDAELDASDNPMAKTASQLANQWCRGRDSNPTRRVGSKRKPGRMSMKKPP
jgi:hypothetical protein